MTSCRRKRTSRSSDATLVTGGEQYSADLTGGSDLGNVYPGASLPYTLTFDSLDTIGQTGTLYVDMRAINDTSVKTASYKLNFNP